MVMSLSILNSSYGCKYIDQKLNGGLEMRANIPKDMRSGGRRGGELKLKRDLSMKRIEKPYLNGTEKEIIRFRKIMEITEANLVIDGLSIEEKAEILRSYKEG